MNSIQFIGYISPKDFTKWSEAKARGLNGLGSVGEYLVIFEGMMNNNKHNKSSCMLVVAYCKNWVITIIRRSGGASASGEYLPLRRGKYPPLFTATFSIKHKFNTNSQIVILFSEEMGFAHHFFSVGMGLSETQWSYHWGFYCCIFAEVICWKLRTLCKVYVIEWSTVADLQPAHPPHVASHKGSFQPDRSWLLLVNWEYSSLRWLLTALGFQPWK